MATQNRNDKPSIVVSAFTQAKAKAEEKYGLIDDKLSEELLFEVMNDSTSPNFPASLSEAKTTISVPDDERPKYHSFGVRYFNHPRVRRRKPAAAKKAESKPGTDLFLQKATDVPAPHSEPEINPSGWELVEDSDTWTAHVCKKTWEIHLFHKNTLTRSESLFTPNRFELGSVSVDDRPSRHKSHPKLHREKGSEIVYRIMSGRLSCKGRQ